MRTPWYAALPILALAVYGTLLLVARSLTYHPWKYPRGSWEAQAWLGAVDVWLRTDDGVRLHAWWVPASESPLATLFVHGNGGNLTHRLGHILAIREAGSSVLMLDYRGYGRSEGWPTEAGLYRDADAAYRHLQELGYPPDRIVLHGESLGTAVAVELASRRPCAGMILEAPFPSAGDVAWRVLPLVGPLVARGFGSKQRIAGFQRPLLVIHGTRDEVIPFEFGRQVYDAAPGPKWFWAVEGAGHNDLLQVAGATYRARLQEFYRRIQP
ncbi:MAG: alpha/beta hydrolase [Bryobacteraceae bacterium]|nr:alpha/beta hydrolase [Bryobacteraceae bacterium]